MEPKSKAFLMSIVFFLLVGYQFTYDTTRSILGGVVGQTGDDYGVGNTLGNYGFILHAIVFALLMKFFVFKNL